MKRRLTLAAALAAALTGCPGSIDDPGRFADQFGTCPDIPMLITTTCAVAGCHAGSSPSGSLDLSAGDVASSLSGKMASGGAGLLVDPSAPDQSVLYTKLTASPPFGSRMPLGKPLDDTTVSCVLTWIETSTKGVSP